MAKVYTKTGDKGYTGLVSGARVSKGHEQIDLYGEVDELNSHLGYLNSIAQNDSYYEIMLAVQNALFDLGSNLACEVEKRLQYKLPQVKSSLIEELESSIDKMDKELQPLKNFILPGGSTDSAYAQICRTVCRRVERKLVRFQDDLPENSLEFLNRLSDFLFVYARFLNKNSGREEILWRP